MKQNINPAVLISVAVFGVLLLAFLVFRAATAPSSTPAPGTAAGKAVAPNQGGGPTEEDLKRMREYNAAHPGAAASRR